MEPAEVIAEAAVVTEDVIVPAPRSSGGGICRSDCRGRRGGRGRDRSRARSGGGSCRGCRGTARRGRRPAPEIGRRSRDHDPCSVAAPSQSATTRRRRSAARHNARRPLGCRRDGGQSRFHQHSAFCPGRPGASAARRSSAGPVPAPQPEPVVVEPVPPFMTTLRNAPNSLQWAVFGGTAAFLGVIWVAIWFAVGK